MYGETDTQRLQAHLKQYMDQRQKRNPKSPDKDCVPSLLSFMILSIQK